jgi:hypothetical protein
MVATSSSSDAIRYSIWGYATNSGSTANTFNFVEYSTAYLYGVKNA